MFRSFGSLLVSWGVEHFIFIFILKSPSVIVISRYGLPQKAFSQRSSSDNSHRTWLSIFSGFVSINLIGTLSGILTMKRINWLGELYFIVPSASSFCFGLKSKLCYDGLFVPYLGIFEVISKFPKRNRVHRNLAERFFLFLFCVTFLCFER